LPDRDFHPERLPLAGVPDGLIARPQRHPDGTVRRDRRGFIKASHVILAPPEEPPPHTDPENPPPGVTATEWRWVLGATRRAWSRIRAKFGQRAEPLAHILARAGTVVLDCEAADLHLGPPLRWRLTAAGLAARDARDTARAAHVIGWETRAAAAAALIADLDEGLAAALTTGRGHQTRLPVLVHAAEDLAAGRVHDGPRAFSQTHFEHTKARDDAPDILTAAGASPETIAALGLRRSPYLGLGGPIRLDLAGQTWDLRGVHGPIQVRADQPLTATLLGGNRPLTLAMIENLQAAETICDQHPAVAVLWTAGQPSDHTLQIAVTLAVEAAEVLIATDADLGGVRIAARIADAVPDATPIRILDAGAHAHDPRDPFGATSRAGLETFAARLDAVGDFARTVAARDYPVEQEAAIRSVLLRSLHRRTVQH
jgi:hypothetical protein